MDGYNHNISEITLTCSYRYRPIYGLYLPIIGAGKMISETQLIYAVFHLKLSTVMDIKDWTLHRAIEVKVP